jgi:formylglycine-generating enzyme required for sulfatase activity
VIRSGAAFLVIALALSWTGNRHDDSFGAQMVPITMTESGGRTLLVSRYEVTVASWRKCYQEGGCHHMPESLAGSGNVPVTGVNYVDVGKYLDWANARSGRLLRLPTIEEWRTINQTIVNKTPQLRFTDPRLAWAAYYGQEKSPSGPPRPIGSFSSTPSGIADLDGNVWEWTSSCFKPGFESATENRCPAFVAAGEHEAIVSLFVRDPASGGCSLGMPPTHLGFRLVSDHSRN